MVWQVVKIGEGTYGEAFKSAGVVLKIVPMEGKELINDASQKLAADLQAEALIALTLTQLKEATDISGTLLDHSAGVLSDAVLVRFTSSGYAARPWFHMSDLIQHTGTCTVKGGTYRNHSHNIMLLVMCSLVLFLLCLASLPCQWLLGFSLHSGFRV